MNMNLPDIYNYTLTIMQIQRNEPHFQSTKQYM